MSTWTPLWCVSTLKRSLFTLLPHVRRVKVRELRLALQPWHTVLHAVSGNPIMRTPYCNYSYPLLQAFMPLISDYSYPLLRLFVPLAAIIRTPYFRLSIPVTAIIRTP
jgi:hypothetical protein